MKKYITIATLLAAGTAIANAADLLAQWDSFAADTKAQYGSAKDSVSINLGVGGATYTDGVLSVNKVNTATNRAYVDLSSAAISHTDGFSVVVDFSGLPTNNGNYPFAVMTGSGFTGGSGDNGLGFGKGNIAGTGSYSYKWLNSNGGSFVYSGGEGGSIPVYTNPETVIFTFDGSSLKLYVGGDLVRTDSQINGSFSDGATFSKLVLGGYSTTNASNSASSFKVKKMAIYSGVISSEQIAAGGYVPEPSAFGLLAGIGALALVASRRRRK